MKRTYKKNQKKNQLPDFYAWHVADREDPFWTRIGAAWEHKDGKGFSIDLELMPVASGRIVLRVYDPDEKEE